jgi:hypothetical protein
LKITLFHIKIIKIFKIYYRQAETSRQWQAGGERHAGGSRQAEGDRQTKTGVERQADKEKQAQRDRQADSDVEESTTSRFTFVVYEYSCGRIDIRFSCVIRCHIILLKR